MAENRSDAVIDRDAAETQEAAGSRSKFQGALKEYEEMNIATMPDDRLLTLKEVMNIVGLKQTSIYQLIKDGKFPKQLKPLGGRCSRWSQREVTNWLEACFKAR